VVSIQKCFDVCLCEYSTDFHAAETFDPIGQPTGVDVSFDRLAINRQQLCQPGNVDRDKLGKVGIECVGQDFHDDASAKPAALWFFCRHALEQKSASRRVVT
jgi:hypothetical protein